LLSGECTPATFRRRAPRISSCRAVEALVDHVITLVVQETPLLDVFPDVSQIAQSSQDRFA